MVHVRLRVVVDDADQEALRRELEHHVRTYGETPAPHLAAKAKANLKRITDVFKQCMDVVSVPTTEKEKFDGR